jgi:hypothetical protein
MMLKAIFLYVILHDDNSSGERFRVQMPDMQTCLKSVESGKMPVPKGTNDYEVMGVMFCGTGEFQRNFNARWLVDPLQKL